MSPPTTPEKVRYYVPFPRIILTGCQPWVATPKGPCPVCGDKIGCRSEWPAGWAFGSIPIFESNPTLRAARDAMDRITFCAYCTSFSPTNEARLARQRGNAEYQQAAKAVSDQTERANEGYRGKLEEHLQALRDDPGRKPILTESFRRRIWVGYRGSVHLSPKEATELEPTNRAKIGRDWLSSIKQEPDWSKVLDHRGKVVGRWEEQDGTWHMVLFTPEETVAA